MAEPVDASDLKSGDGNIVWVQVPLAPSEKRSAAAALFFCISQNPQIVRGSRKLKRRDHEKTSVLHFVCGLRNYNKI